MKKVPTPQQQHFINTIVMLVDNWLAVWPRQSGKTWARMALAERILKDEGITKDQFTKFLN